MSVFRVETATDLLGVQSLHAYQRRFTAVRLAAKRGVPVESVKLSKSLDELTLVAIPSPAALSAWINHGRWVATCLCGAGLALHPEWSWAGCLDCGATYAHIEFPDRATQAAILTALGLRPNGPPGRRQMHRSWLPGETLEALDRESLMRGWAVESEGPPDAP